MERIIDLSQRIDDIMPVYPGDNPTLLKQTSFFNKDNCNIYNLETCLHTGTHIDSPLHMTANGEYIGDVQLDRFIGIGCIIDVRGQNEIHMKDEYMDIVKPESIVLLYTGFDKLYGAGAYYTDHPVVGADMCRFLADMKIKALGLDMPSPDRSPYVIHRELFSNGICIIENLTNLDKLLNVPCFEIMALPLKISADSSIARVAARVID